MISNEIPNINMRHITSFHQKDSPFLIITQPQTTFLVLSIVIKKRLSSTKELFTKYHLHVIKQSHIVHTKRCGRFPSWFYWFSKTNILLEIKTIKLKYYLLMSSEIWKEFGEYQTLELRHIVSLENCFICKAPQQPVTNNNFFHSQL